MTMHSLHVRAKKGNLDLYNELFPPMDPFIDDDRDFKPMEIDTNYLVPKDTQDTNGDQQIFKAATDEFMTNGKNLGHQVPLRFWQDDLFAEAHQRA